MIRAKICCISSVAEAELAVRLGASALGLVSEMPSGPGVISEDLIAEIAATVPPTVTSVLLTSYTDVDGIVTQQRRCGVSAVQLVEPLLSDTHRALKERLPGVAIIQVVHVTGVESLTESLTMAPSVDALLLDTGVRSGPGKQLGGTGRTHDWSISAQIVAQVSVPVMLAGGLRPENVSEAIAAVKPHAVDVCSGVRVDQRLNEERLLAFMNRLKGA